MKKLLVRLVATATRRTNDAGIRACALGRIRESEWVARNGDRLGRRRVFNVIIICNIVFFEHVDNGRFVEFLILVNGQFKRPRFNVTAQNVKQDGEFVWIVDNGRSGEKNDFGIIGILQVFIKLNGNKRFCLFLVALRGFQIFKLVAD